MVNDQHAHAGYAAYDGYQTGSFETDPLFGNLPGGHEGSPAHNGQYDTTQWDSGAHQTAGYDAYGTPQYDAGGQWATAADAGYQQPADHLGQPDATGQWDADAWNQANQLNGPVQTGQFDNTPFDQAQFDQTQFDQSQFDQTQFDGSQFGATQFGYGASDQPVPLPFDPAQAAHFETAQFDAGQFQAAPFAHEPTAQWAAPAFDTGAYDATAWNSGGTTPDAAPETLLSEAVVPEQYHPDAEYTPDGQYDPQQQYDPQAQYAQDGPYETDGPYDADGQYTPDGQYSPQEHYGPDAEDDVQETGSDNGSDAQAGHDDDPESDQVHMAATMTAPAITLTPRPVRRAGGSANGSRGRRRTPAKRSALLTVAVPSACVMGVAGIAAASVGGLGGEETQDDTTTTASAPDPGSVKPVAANNKLDTQLAALSADARDFGDRASRTQERIDLKARQEAEKKQREEEAARKEALRPKFVLPVSQHGLSAYYGQAGVNWMSVHTGIDFPVAYGTPVMAATDGTVRTQYNSAYGNMAIVTAADGTETWYCHLSTTKIRSGTVKAGDVIAYSGNSGNSTGPHLHFEVRPGGGSAIDPLPWLRSHGVSPT
ncbi:peptidoglycan DD-metalloendopeptidase family protein [Streptomyces sp. NPDC058200]|uniref:M23 family metallopeptidase n=1 Tax=Streptomyces sp. NPDC058200 TaxID=3346378 RepID=UPI0036EF85B5